MPAPYTPPRLRLTRIIDPRYREVRLPARWGYLINNTIEALFNRRVGPFHASGADSGIDVAPAEAMALFGVAETLVVQTAQLAEHAHRAANLPIPPEVTAALSSSPPSVPSCPRASVPSSMPSSSHDSPPNKTTTSRSEGRARASKRPARRPDPSPVPSSPSDSTPKADTAPAPPNAA